MIAYQKTQEKQKQKQTKKKSGKREKETKIVRSVVVANRCGMALVWFGLV